MREVKLEQLGENVERALAASARERLVLTRGGKPVAIVMRVENLDQEDLSYIESADFWKMIAERRKEPRISLTEAKARLAAREKLESQR